MDQQSGQGREGREAGQAREEMKVASQELERTAAQQRHRSQQLARQLSREAVQQWQRSIEGLLALPTATALGLASTTLYLAALVERGFEMAQQSVEAVRSATEHARYETQRAMSERQRMEVEQERGGDAGRARLEAKRGETTTRIEASREESNRGNEAIA